MWVFDGEEWTQDDGSVQSTPKSNAVRPQRFEEFVPELQVIEILPVPAKNTYVPPLPMP